MATFIDIKIKQEYLHLTPQTIVPNTEDEGIIFVSTLDNKPRYRAPNNGTVFVFELGLDKAKNLIYAANENTNGLLYWLGTQFDTQPWINPASQYCYLSYSSHENSTNNWGIFQLSSRELGFVSTSDIPDSYFSVELYPPDSIKLSGIYIRSPDRGTYGFPTSWNLTSTDTMTNITSILYEAVDSPALDGIDKEIFIPISPAFSATSKVTFNMIGTNTIGTNTLCLGQMELYGLFL